MILFAYVFIAEITGDNTNRGEAASFPAVVRLVVQQAATQQFMKDHHLNRRKAR